MAERARLAPPRPERDFWPWHQVKAASLPASVLLGGDRRLEAENYLLSGYGLRAAMEARGGWVSLGTHARVWQPSRLKGIQVSPEFGTPFLAATQVFDLRPVPRKWLSPQQIKDSDALRVKPGMILVTRSGTVGRATLAYAPHLDTIISDDLLRVEARDAKHWGWLYAYLRAPSARAMMTSAQYGHIIKHLEVGHLSALPLPELDDESLDQFTAQARAVLALRDEAHTATVEAEARFAECLGPCRSLTAARVASVFRRRTLFLAGGVVSMPCPTTPLHMRCIIIWRKTDLDSPLRAKPDLMFGCQIDSAVCQQKTGLILFRVLTCLRSIQITRSA